MPRFYGNIGYGIPTDKGNGVWEDTIEEYPYFGDVLQNYRKYDEAKTQANPDLTLSNTISIVADQYAIEHFHLIKYVEWEGVRWTANTVKVERPRLTIWLGRVYNGPTPED